MFLIDSQCITQTSGRRDLGVLPISLNRYVKTKGCLNFAWEVVLIENKKTKTRLKLVLVESKI